MSLYPENHDLTSAQLRALCWLPDDGTWFIKPPGTVTPGIDSLYLSRHDLCEVEWGDFGPYGGRCRRVRLTEAGVLMRKQMESQK